MGLFRIKQTQLLRTSVNTLDMPNTLSARLFLKRAKTVCLQDVFFFLIPYTYESA